MNEMTKNAPFGFLLVDKEEGMTSTDVDRIAKRIFRTRRVGHLGTLDPFATGLLVLAVGEATKMLPLLDDGKKTYRATLAFGKETDTLDKTGTTIRTLSVPDIDVDDIQRACSSLAERKCQIPPSYSAKRIDGRRAYDIAREGGKIDLPPISIAIERLELLSYDKNEQLLSFETTVSKGTYIRSLGRDIAQALGTCGHLLSLRRLAIGPLSLERAQPSSLIRTENLLPPESILPSLKVIEVDKALSKKAGNGCPLIFPTEISPLLLIRDEKRNVAVYEKRGGKYHCRFGFAHD